MGAQIVEGRERDTGFGWGRVETAQELSIRRSFKVVISWHTRKGKKVYSAMLDSKHLGWAGTGASAKEAVDNLKEKLAKDGWNVKLTICL